VHARLSGAPARGAQAVQLALLSSEQLAHVPSFSSLVAGTPHPLSHLASVRPRGLTARRGLTMVL
jgi:hypothetical protein